MTEAELALAVQKIAIYGTILAALVGGAFGFLGNWVSTALTKKSERRQQLLQLGFELGMKEYGATAETIKSLPAGSTATQPPPQAYVHFNMRFIELLETGKLTPETYKELLAERDRLTAVIPILKIETGK
jgi:hypothetical protein